MEVKAAPGPYQAEMSGKAGSNGDFNMYLVDKNGRKIAAVWGKRGEKEATGRLLMACHDMLSVLKAMDAQGGHGIREHDAMRNAINLVEGRTE